MFVKKKMNDPYIFQYFGCASYLINRKGMQEVLKKVYIKAHNMIVLNGLHCVNEIQVYDIANSYIYTKPLFYTRDDLFATTIQDISHDLIVPGTSNVKSVVNGSNGYGLTINKHINEYYSSLTNKNGDLYK